MVIYLVRPGKCRLREIDSGKAAAALLAVFFLFVVIATASAQSVFEDVPADIDTGHRYLFFLHGKIVEDSGVRPVSERFGVYEYEKILAAFAERGFDVISEARKRETDVSVYAGKVAGQVRTLLAAGVPPSSITVVGASKGGAIAAAVSSTVSDTGVNYVLIASCSEKFINTGIEKGMYLKGNVLSIFEASDEFTCSCRKFFDASRGKGLGRHREIRLDTGLHHGFHYTPLLEWVDPVVEWAGGEKTRDSGPEEAGM